MHRIIPGPWSTSGRLTVFAPARSKSAPDTEALPPAPFSTETSAPRAMNFFTVSGITTQRVSSCASFNTAIFMRCGLVVKDDQDDECDDQDDQCAPFQHLDEPRVVADMHRHILSGRIHEQGFFFGHECSLRTSVAGVHNKGLRSPQVLSLTCTRP